MKLFSLSSKSVFGTKSACFNIEVKLFAVKILNSWVVTYSSWLWSLIFFSISIIFNFLTKLLTLGILFSPAFDAVLVARLVISGILPSISVTFVLKCAFVTKLFTLAVLFPTIDSSVFVARVLTFEL